MAFFKSKGLWNESRGLTGTYYRFTQAEAVEVTDPQDVAKFRSHRDVLIEVTPPSAPVEPPKPSASEQVIRKPEPSPEAVAARDAVPEPPKGPTEKRQEAEAKAEKSAGSGRDAAGTPAPSAEPTKRVSRKAKK